MRFSFVVTSVEVGDMVLKPRELDGSEALSDEDLQKILEAMEQAIDEGLKHHYTMPGQEYRVRLDRLPHLGIRGERSEKLFEALLARYREAGWQVSVRFGYGHPEMAFTAGQGL